MDLLPKVLLTRPIPEYEDYIAYSDGRIWSAKSKKFIGTVKNDGYVGVQLRRDGEYKGFLVHRLIACCFIPNVDETKTEIDHIDGNRSNNVVSNLRWVSREENSWNRGRNSGKTTPKGVCWDKQYSKWRVRIWHNKKCINLGKFDTLEEAEAVRRKKEAELRGDYMRD